MPKTSLRARFFWLISRAAHAFYTRFPVLGVIRGAVCLIRRDGGYLVIERNDGLGLGLPGGIMRRNEAPEETLRREVREETGLAVETATLVLTFELKKPFPVHTFVFEVSAQGDLRESWEGVPTVVSLEDLQQRIVAPQRPIIDFLLKRDM